MPDAALALLLIAALGHPAAADIYRCDQGDTTVFSDVPCSETAEVFESPAGISVIAAADDLDEAAERNKTFIEQRREKLAARAERAARLAQQQQAERSRQRRAAAEAIRYRTIISPGAYSGFANGRRSPTDPRSETQRQRTRADDEPGRRRTLLSRSGGNQSRILR